MKDLDEFLELGVEEYFAGPGITLIEWADRVADCLPGDHLEVLIEITGPESRRFDLRATGPAADETLDATGSGTGLIGVGRSKTGGLMHKTPWRERREGSRRKPLPQARLGHDLPDPSQGNRQGLVVQQSLGFVRRQRQNQFEILAIGQCVFERSDTVAALSGQLPGGRIERDRIQDERGATPAGCASRGRSSDNPSLTSIPACSVYCSCNASASRTRGVNVKCRPRMLPPNAPSPGWRHPAAPHLAATDRVPCTAPRR